MKAQTPDTTRNALTVIRDILNANSLITTLEFGIYHPTLVHFKEQKKVERRDPFEATEHSKAQNYFKIKRAELLEGSVMEDRVAKLLPGQALQVLSVAYIRQLKSRIHIPMIDLEIEPVDENLEFAENSIKALRQPHGAILLSGASYHYYGYELLTHAEWQNFMYRALLLDDVADRRWVGHRLLDGFSNLRVSPKQGRYEFIPKVVKEF